MADDPLRENAVVRTLLDRGAERAMLFRGWVGPSTREGHIRLYPRLGDLSQSLEIARADIIHSTEEPQAVLGAVVVWVNKDAKIVVHRVETPGAPAATALQKPASYAGEIRRGRLRMRIRARAAGDDTCVCICSCGTCECRCIVIPNAPE